MLETDLTGLNHSYLASEENFKTLREFERNNLLVPIVGDFGGEKAVRAVGSYLREHGATVNYFYTSNVEQYLFQSDAWEKYYNNVATLPLNDKSTFIRAYFNMGFRYPPASSRPICTPCSCSIRSRACSAPSAPTSSTRTATLSSARNNAGGVRL